MAAYSLDLRERMVEAVERQGGSKREIARLFGVHESFLYKLLRQKRERGDLAPLPHGGGAQAKLTAENWQQVASWIAATPDATISANLRKMSIPAPAVCAGVDARLMPGRSGATTPVQTVT